MKNPKLIIGIVAIIVLLIIFFIIFRYSRTTTRVVGGTTVQQQGFFQSLVSLFQPKGTSTGGGAQAAASLFCQIFPKACGQGTKCDPMYSKSIYGDCDCYNGQCSSSNIGYDCQGNKTTYCD